jgi:3-dehydroquinate dehydratase II
VGSSRLEVTYSFVHESVNRHPKEAWTVPRHRILVVNGPNLNLLGRREPAVYGTVTLGEITARLKEVAGELDCTIDVRQHNHEGVLIDWLQEAADTSDGVVLNPAGLTHYSHALRDAVAAIAPLPVIEVHISNIHAREEFRHLSVISPVAAGIVIGWGALGYEVAVRGLVAKLQAGGGER